MEKSLILELLEAAAEHGVPAIKETIEAYQKEEITLEDIQNLRKGIKKPEEYFK